MGRDEFVALLRDGRLVVVSAGSGRVTRTVLRNATAPGDTAYRFDDQYGLALSPDRRSVFMTTPLPAGSTECRGGGAVERVDLGTGARTRIGTGARPDVSPDGTRLAYVTRCAREGLVVRDLRTGAERLYAHAESEGEAAPWALHEGVWHADGKRLWVVVDWENSSELRLLDPATDRTTNDAGAVATRYGTYGLDRRGGELAYFHSCCYADDTGDDLLVIRGADGVERVLVKAHSTEQLAPAEVGPGGDLLYVRKGRLHRIDRDGRGPAKDLGPSTAFARDW